ncbi:hypothetical protein ACFQ4X_06990 [Fictibacillus halophilus]|uniref:hypothetical protein n=1 Tax=Fictibacillus halophilus TaxID=1610490 RepID=UPI00363D1380
MKVSITGYRKEVTFTDTDDIIGYEVYFEVDGTFELFVYVDSIELTIGADDDLKYEQRAFEEQYEHRMKELVDSVIEEAIQHPKIPKEIISKLKAHRLKRIYE